MTPAKGVVEQKKCDIWLITTPILLGMKHADDAFNHTQNVHFLYLTMKKENGVDVIA